MADRPNDARGERADRESLLVRPGLPDDLLLLRERYPREVWPNHRNLGQLARMWLGRHGMFRELGTEIGARTDGFRNGKAGDPATFMSWLAPRFNFFLRELHGHHMIEDQHYFPVFRAADNHLARGFDILDADHETIDRFIHELAEAGVALDRAIASGNATDGESVLLAERLHATLGALHRHLDDEEDLIVPLILDRSEAGLGVG
ncbi:MAG: hemerythrin domain-containing protein [Acuticoccus sp.]